MQPRHDRTALQMACIRCALMQPAAWAEASAEWGTNAQLATQQQRMRWSPCPTPTLEAISSAHAAGPGTGHQGPDAGHRAPVTLTL